MKKHLISLFVAIFGTALVVGADVATLSVSEIRAEKYDNVAPANMYSTGEVKQYIRNSLRDGYVPQIDFSQMTVEDFQRAVLEATLELGVTQNELLEKLKKGEDVNLATEIRVKQKQTGVDVKRLVPKAQ